MIVASRWVPAGFDALTMWPFIFVRPEYKDDKALIAHELVHYDSMAWVTPFWWLRYILSKSFRWAQEVKAYKVQIAMSGITAPQAAELLVQYQTGHTYEYALVAVQT